MTDILSSNMQSEAWKTVNEMIREFGASLPRIIFAVIIAMLFYFLSRAVKALVRRTRRAIGDRLRRLSASRTE